jgi:hypothetical protein
MDEWVNVWMWTWMWTRTEAGIAKDVVITPFFCGH